MFSQIKLEILYLCVEAEKSQRKVRVNNLVKIYTSEIVYIISDVKAILQWPFLIFSSSTIIPF